MQLLFEKFVNKIIDLLDNRPYHLQWNTVQGVWDYRTLFLSRKQSISEKNVSDKSCGVL